jgi:hypothetical protein
MNRSDDQCADCRNITEGGRGMLPHAGLVRWCENERECMSIYSCRQCGGVWEYRVGGLLLGWHRPLASDATVHLGMKCSNLTSYHYLSGGQKDSPSQPK